MAQGNQGNARAWRNASEVIGKTIRATLDGVDREVARRTYRASNELRNASLHVLRGSRSGRTYTVPNTRTKYRASAPGEPPAVRTGIFRLSWGTHVRVEKAGTQFKAVAAIESREKAGKHLLGELLEEGHGRTAPRPYKQKVIDRALPKIKAIYSRPYGGS